MSTCPRCQAEFTCGMQNPNAAAPCWCTALPPLPSSAYRAASGCYCPRCLNELVGTARQAGTETGNRSG